jgi:hypothetical protein
MEIGINVDRSKLPDAPSASKRAFGAIVAQSATPIARTIRTDDPLGNE